MASIGGHTPFNNTPLRKGKEAESAPKTTTATTAKTSTTKSKGKSSAPSRKESLLFQKLVEARKLKKMGQRKARKRRRRKKKKRMPEVTSNESSQ